MVKGQITACGFVTSTSLRPHPFGPTRSERPDYRLRFCYGKEFKAWAVDYFKVKGQITACGFVTRIHLAAKFECGL